MKRVSKLVIVSALCLSLCGCAGMLNIIPGVCAWQGVATAVKNFAVQVMADAKARLTLLQGELEQAEDEGAIAALKKAIDVTTTVLDRAMEIYSFACTALNQTEWEQAESTLQGEVTVMKGVYNTAMQKARMARLK